MSFGTMSHFQPYLHPLWQRGPNPRHSMSFQCRKGLLNNPGENNCFVNSAVQVLWHLDVFRRSFRQLSGHQCMGNSCIFCALKVIFTQFQYSDQDALPPDALRKALAETFSDQERFQIGVMDDAAECFENILVRIHFHIASNEKEDMCNARHCIPHQKFAMTIVEQYRCTCGATSEPLPFSQMVHYVSTSALVAEATYALQQPSPCYFGQLLCNAGARGEMDKECPSKCGRRVKASRTLTNAPDVVSIGLVWDSEKSDIQHIQNVVRSIGTTLYLPDLYHSIDPSRACDLQLVGVVCYYGKHYSTFFYNSKARLWVYFDDATVKEVGPQWQKVADKICRGRYQPLLLLYTNPNAEPIDASTAPKLKTMVPGHSWNNEPSPPHQDQNSRDYRQSDNYVGQDRSDGARGGWNHLRSQNKEKFQKQLKERRAITPTPGSTGYDKGTAQNTRRAITPGPENWYNGYQDTGVHHDRKPSYLDAMETTEISQPDQGKQKCYSVHPELLRSASVPYTKSTPQSHSYQGVGYDNPVATGYDQTDDCGTGGLVTNESTQISLGVESAPMFQPVQSNWSAPSDNPVGYDSYTLSNSDQYRRPSIPATQVDRAIMDKRDELVKPNDKQKKNSFKGGKGRRKVGADVIRYQTSSSFNFEGMESKENGDIKSVKRMHSADDEKSRGFVSKHDTPITSGLATLPRNRKAKKSVQDSSRYADYVPLQNQKNSSNYVETSKCTPAVTNKPRVRPMSASNHNREVRHISRNNWDEELDEPIYIDRKAVEMILNRQCVQLKRQASSSSAASKESQDSGHHSVVSSYVDYSHTKPQDRHTLKVDIPNADNVSIGSYKDSGYRSGDRNSASSISSLSMESPTVDTVSMYNKNGPSLIQQARDNRHGHGVHKKVRNVRSVGSNEVSSFSSSVESLGSTQSGNHHVVQKPVAVNKGGAIVHQIFPDAKNDAERCELLCNHAEDLVDESVVKEQTGDLRLALVLCTQAVDYFKQILDLNPVDQQMVQHAHMKHNMCVLRSRALHRRILAKQDGHNETGHDDLSSTTSTEISNKSLQEVSQPVPVNHVSNSHPMNNPQFHGKPSAIGGPGFYPQVPGYHVVNGHPGHVTQPQVPGQRSLNEPNQNLELRDYAKCTPHAPSDVKLRPPLVPQNLQVTLSQPLTVLEPNHSKQSSASSNSTIEVYATLPRKNKSPNESPEKNKNDIDVYRSYLSRQRSQANTSTQVAHSAGNTDKPKPTVPVRSDSLSPNSTPVKATVLEAKQTVSLANENRNTIQPPGEANPPSAGDKNTHSVLNQQNSQLVSGPSQVLHTNSANQSTSYQTRTDNRGQHVHSLVHQPPPAPQSRSSQMKQTSAGIVYERRASNYDYPDKDAVYNHRQLGSSGRNINPDYDYPERYCKQVGSRRPETYHSQPQQSYTQPFQQAQNTQPFQQAQSTQPIQQAQSRDMIIPPYQPPSGQQHPPSYQQHFQRSRSTQPVAPPNNYRTPDQYQTSQHFYRSVSQPSFSNSQHQKQMPSRRPVEVIQPPDGVPVHMQTASFSSNSSSNTVNSQQNTISQSNLPSKSRNRPSSAVAANRRLSSQTSSNYHDPREVKVGDLKRYKSTPSISVPSDHDTLTDSADVSEHPNVSVKERLRALENQQMDVFRKQQGWLSQKGMEGPCPPAVSREDCPAVNSGCTSTVDTSADVPPPLPAKKNRKMADVHALPVKKDLVDGSCDWSQQLSNAPSSDKIVEQWLQNSPTKMKTEPDTTEKKVASVRSLRSKFENLTSDCHGDEVSLTSSNSENPNTNVSTVPGKKKKPKRKKSVTFSDSIALITEAEDVPANMEYLLEWALKSQDRMKEGKYVIVTKPNATESCEEGGSNSLLKEKSEKMLGYDSDCEDNTSDSCDSSEDTGNNKLIRCCLCRKAKVDVSQSYCEKCKLYFARLQKSSV